MAGNSDARPFDRSRPLAVVVISYNSADTLPGLLSSLEPSLAPIAEREVVVVDNASRDESIAVCENHSVGVRAIHSPVNCGYAAAINIAMETIDPRADLLILNPDIRLFPETIERMQACLADPAVGIAVPRILEETGELSLSLRRDQTLASAWSEALLGGRLAGQLGLSEVLSEPDVYDCGRDVEWATGAILLVSAEARRRVGTWDESFFLYSEEVDFMRRVRQAGLKVRYHPDAQAIHIGGDTRASPYLYSLNAANRVLDYSRNHGPLAAALMRSGTILGEALRSWRGREHRAALMALLGLKLLPRHG